MCIRMKHGLWVVAIMLSITVLPVLATSTSEGKSKDNIYIGIDEYAFIATSKPVIDKQPSTLTTDHSKLKALQGPFNSGPEVTRVCLECHNTAGYQFKQNKHWTWDYQHPETGQSLGKKNLVNNFCTNARGNEGMCAQCHAGYNWKDDSFDFDNQENIDCLICHESTGTYYKTPTTEGSPACEAMFVDRPPIDWAKVAQSVGTPGRQNCGSCHFFGGGGDNVKHGDLSSVLFAPDRDVDVHMDASGLNFSCITCHVGEGHEWAGSRYEMTVSDAVGKGKPGMPREVASCASCHGLKPHAVTSIEGFKLNRHTDRVACVTCHIPEIARGGVATKVEWDWRTMGKLKDGEGFKLKEHVQGDGSLRATYKSIKGDFKFDENFAPMYAWFDGTMNYTTIDTRFDPDKSPIEINSFSGSPDDPNSILYPFKLMKTIMPYDKVNNTLVYMELWGNTDTSLWGNFDFAKAIEAGMAKFNLPYSGEWGFVETYSYWPVNHMVAPKEAALSCNECHAKDGRLSHLDGFYMPGVGRHPWLENIGILLVLGTLAGVLGHAVMRGFASRRRNG